MTETSKNCANCAASCCRFEVFLITDTGVPEEHIHLDAHGMQTMLRLDDGWCSALNRDTMACSIYEYRPWLCREFEMGSPDCLETWQAKHVFSEPIVSESIVSELIFSKPK